jgi:predicted Fe-Mo cluster-binding NifX family protein
VKVVQSNNIKENKNMKICFPTDDLRGLDSVVFSHFGSAPGFVVVDTESKGIEEINNSDMHHVHGMCQPLKALGGLSVDAVAVGGIGMGALMKLQAMGITVYRAQSGTVGQNISLLMNQGLPQFDPSFTCSGHKQGGCAH